MIEIIDCWKAFEYPVLAGVNARVNRGDFIILKGDSGSGKTTLLNIIAGTVKSDKGTIIVNSTDITKLPDSARSVFRNANIGYIRQTSGLVPWLNCRDNLELAFYISEISTAKKNQIIAEFSEIFGLNNILNKFPDKISGGQYQRVAIASSIIKSPQIILADEPTNNIDKKSLKILLELFATYKNRKTVMIVSHIDIFDTLASQIWNLNNGKIEIK